MPLGGMEWIHVGCAVRLPQAHFGDPKMKKEIELPGYLSDMWQGVSFIFDDRISDCLHVSNSIVNFVQMNYQLVMVVIQFVHRRLVMLAPIHHVPHNFTIPENNAYHLSGVPTIVHYLSLLSWNTTHGSFG